ncbi:MAG: hypothetical protein ACK55I_20000, partial [bacterium]
MASLAAALGRTRRGAPKAIREAGTKLPAFWKIGGLEGPGSRPPAQEPGPKARMASSSSSNLPACLSPITSFSMEVVPGAGTAGPAQSVCPMFWKWVRSKALWQSK